jgi:hypothetical protein
MLYIDSAFYRLIKIFIRMESERIIAIDAISDVILKSGISVKDKKVYCIGYWNKIEIGRTQGKYVSPRVKQHIQPSKEVPSDSPDPVAHQSEGDTPLSAVDQALAQAVTRVDLSRLGEGEEHQTVATPITTESRMRRMAIVEQFDYFFS